MAPGRVRAVVTADPATGAETTTPADTVVVGLGLAPRDILARMAGDGAGHRRRRCGRRPATPPAADRGRRLRLHGHDRRRPRRGVGSRLHRARAPQALEPGVSRHVPGRRLPAQRPLVDRRPHRRHPRPVHRPSRVAPDHPGRGLRRHLRRRLPADPAPRRASRGSAPGWTGSVAGGGRGTTAMPSRSTGRSARASRSATSRRSASWSSPGPTSWSSSSGSTRATSRTSSPAARATRCCSTSAATSWTTG